MSQNKSFASRLYRIQVQVHIARLNPAMLPYNQGVDRMEELMMKLLSELQEFRDETRQALDRIEKKLDATFEQAAGSAEGVTEIKTAAAQISATQERHERILEVLSLRSIEHESYIKRT